MVSDVAFVPCLSFCWCFGKAVFMICTVYLVYSLTFLIMHFILLNENSLHSFPKFNMKLFRNWANNFGCKDTLYCAWSVLNRIKFLITNNWLDNSVSRMIKRTDWFGNGTKLSYKERNHRHIYLKEPTHIHDNEEKQTWEFIKTTWNHNCLMSKINQSHKSVTKRNICK